mmetsp:Transcript_7100/g.9895  ORF Transcript_7100/g.9895 Transcript_7100/m.9895 type:complete len:119 (+) Transcript_7100:77-433(+)
MWFIVRFLNERRRARASQRRHVHRCHDRQQGGFWTKHIDGLQQVRGNALRMPLTRQWPDRAQGVPFSSEAGGVGPTSTLCRSCKLNHSFLLGHQARHPQISFRTDPPITQFKAKNHSL